MTAACLLVRSPACSARQLQTSIVQVVHLCPTGFRKEPCERLERHKPKGLRVVLRGLGSSNAPRLPGGGGGDVTSLPDPGWGTTQVYPATQSHPDRCSWRRHDRHEGGGRPRLAANSARGMALPPVGNRLRSPIRSPAGPQSPRIAGTPIRLGRPCSGPGMAQGPDPTHRRGPRNHWQDGRTANRISPPPGRSYHGSCGCHLRN